MSKARIRMLEGPEALYFLEKAFTSCHGDSSNALVALPLTAKWLSSLQEGKDDEWNEHKGSLSELFKIGGNHADTSSTPNATNFDTVGPHEECKGEEIDLLVSRIIGLSEGELPETMNLNFSRLRSVQSEVQKIIVIATSLLVLRQSLLSQQIASSQAQRDIGMF